MTTRLFLTVILSLAGTASTFTQSPGRFSTAGAEQSVLAGTVDSLTRFALFTLTGAIVLAGLVFISYVMRSCADLKKSQSNARNTILHLLIWAAGLGTFGSSCSPAQQARAAAYQAAQESDNSRCPMNRHYDPQVNERLNNRYPCNGHSNWHGPVYCRYCGKRIYNSRY